LSARVETPAMKPVKLGETPGREIEATPNQASQTVIPDAAMPQRSGIQKAKKV
jgi:hypothetical protein